ncbi:unnamed protein product [Caenorhabditis nigoni]|nr:hypothetical protein B9Z55_002971 [Caenorhabditis nigoni]
MEIPERIESWKTGVTLGLLQRGGGTTYTDSHGLSWLIKWRHLNDKIEIGVIGNFTENCLIKLSAGFSFGEDKRDDLSITYDEVQAGQLGCKQTHSMNNVILLAGAPIACVNIQVLLNIAHIKKLKSKDFDESNASCSDFVVEAKGEKFYISKKYLTGHCPVLHEQFIKENITTEWRTDKLDPSLFQEFLEVLYLVPDAIMDYNVIYLLRLAKLWKARTVTRQCELFLMKHKNLNLLKLKFQLANEFDLFDLENWCVSQVSKDSAYCMVQRDYGFSERAIAALRDKLDVSSRTRTSTCKRK